MTRLALFIIALVTCFTASAAKYSYSFSNTPVSEALVTLGDDYPDLNLSFIYKELDFYRTSGRVDADDPYTALRQIVGLNPILVTEKNGVYYIEAMQHGKHVYTGRVVADDGDPVAAATVKLLAPKDSTVLSYAVTDSNGRFNIPCDIQGAIAKVTCVGYLPVVKNCDSFNLGTVRMTPQPLQLKAVSVEAQMNSTYSDKSIYTPSGRQKKASQNAIDLLRMMAIPQIRVSLSSNTVTDNSGADVTIFINSLEASSEEMEGLRTADVRRVEYLEFPTDPRFHGAQRVINIIVQEYAYGGYTKTTVNENCLTGLSGRVSVFSKFAYKKMTFDLYAATSNSDVHHVGTNTEATYNLTDEAGKVFTLDRNETTETSHYKRNEYPVTFRATYATDKVQIRNLIGFTYTGIPDFSYSGRLTYSPSDQLKGYEFERNNPSRTNALAYSGTYFFSLPNGFSLDFSPSASYSHINDRTIYSVSERPEIYRHAREDASNFRLNLYLRKKIGTKHSFMIGGNGGDIINRLEYLGANGYRDKFNNPFGVGMLGYNYITRKFSLSIDGGIVVEKSDINGQKHTDPYPFTHINLKYALSRKSSFSMYFQYATNSPGISEKSPDILQENEVLYISGNPMLESSRHTTVTLNYSWLPSNRFGMNLFGIFYGLYDRMMTVYSPYKDGAAVIRSYRNNGDFLNGRIGVSANYKLLDGNLQLYGNVQQNFYKSTGIFNYSCNPMNLLAEATYYLNNLYFMGAYEGSTKTMGKSAPVISQTRDSYRIAAGWSNSDWNIRLTAYNFFNKGWAANEYTTISSCYTSVRTAIGSTYHPRINLSATYTFGYGKKVQRRNEVGQQEGASSAILK